MTGTSISKPQTTKWTKCLYWSIENIYQTWLNETNYMINWWIGASNSTKWNIIRGNNQPEHKKKIHTHTTQITENCWHNVHKDNNKCHQICFVIIVVLFFCSPRHCCPFLFIHTHTHTIRFGMNPDLFHFYYFRFFPLFHSKYIIISTTICFTTVRIGSESF